MQSLQYLIIALLISSGSYAQQAPCELSGTWKHADKNAWLEVDLAAKTVFVKSHLDNPDAEGLTVIQNLKPAWSGDMYNASTGDFVPVQLTFHGCDQLSVTDNGVAIVTLLRE
ncbi:hypothetical protein LJ739_11490 [Aestuariibacter halophilus]|uniref:Uncharacterized protein n=1 Tax=Fluctibacter halophilus TaxID=226011 RepID=A0ABS8G9S1_9ALTE|nr:hypothetical protein [Aestuariibacter halophilus]MCC2616866.1 hypothetical protein [Aestuariibacter halophilus]